MFTLYNLNTQEESKPRISPYLIDGKIPVLPPEIIELQIIDEPAPSFSGAFKLEPEKTINLETKTITNGWKLSPITDLEEYKNYKLESLNLEYEKIVAAGVKPDNLNNTLAATNEDRNSFGQLLSLLREYEELLPEENRAYFKQSQVTITDLHGSPVQVTVNDFRAAMIDYGNKINAIWTEFAIQKNKINTLTTIQ